MLRLKSIPESIDEQVRLYWFACELTCHSANKKATPFGVALIFLLNKSIRI
jgi:hypothetical protein